MSKIISGAYLCLVVGAIIGFITSNISSVVPLGIIIFVVATLISLISIPLCFLYRKHKEYLDLYLGMVMLSISVDTLILTGILQIFKFSISKLFYSLIVLLYIYSLFLWIAYFRKRESNKQSFLNVNNYSIFWKTGVTIAIMIGIFIGGILIRVSTQKTLYSILDIICIIGAFGLQFRYIKLFIKFKEITNK